MSEENTERLSFISEILIDTAYPHEKKGNKLYFTNVPEDVEVNKKTPSYENWSSWRQSNYHFFSDELNEYPNQTIILDIGAGPSQFRSLFERFQTYGVDFYPYEKVDIVVNLNMKLPIRSHSVDIVVLSNVIEHIPDTKLLLSECYRILKDGGKIIATIPFMMREHQIPYDFNRYTHYGLQYQFSAFKDVKVRALGSPVHVYDTIQRQFFLHYLKNDLINRLLYYIERLILRVIRKSNRTISASEVFTEGYGVIGFK